MQKAGNKAVFLDRDGTINVEKEYLYKIENFEYLDGALDGLKALTDMGYLLVIVTNQSGIARGYYTEEDYYKLDEWLKEDLLSNGIVLAGTYFCPHLPDGIVSKYACDCECRKPKTGLFWKAAKDLNIDMDSSFAIGDKVRDLSICRESSVKGILLCDDDAITEEYETCRNWKEIVKIIKHFRKDNDEY